MLEVRKGVRSFLVKVKALGVKIIAEKQFLDIIK